MSPDLAIAFWFVGFSMGVILSWLFDPDMDE